MAKNSERHPVHTFDIDNYLNYLIPRPRWHILPTPVSRWFGYRKPATGDTTTKPATSVLLVWLFSFLGGFIGIAIIENVFLNLPHLDGHQVPIVIASFGAAAILEYNAIESPLAQPRNLIFGHFLSAVIGVAFTKAFRSLGPERFDELRWVAGALSVGVASAAMSMTKTIHPPAGATALLASTSAEITALGWWLCALVLLASSLMLASALLINNLYKRFPTYWWTPADLSKFRFGEQETVVKAKDEEKGNDKADSSSSVRSSDAGLGKQGSVDERLQQYDTTAQKMSRNIHEHPELRVLIEADRIIVPYWMSLSTWQVTVLEEFQQKLREAALDGK